MLGLPPFVMRGLLLVADAEIEANGQQTPQAPEHKAQGQKHDDQEGQVGMPGAGEEAYQVGECGDIWCHGEMVVPRFRDFGQTPRELRSLPGARKSRNRSSSSIRPRKGPFEPV
jgi:hypothetical protein